jgi:hypothetical protein
MSRQLHMIPRDAIDIVRWDRCVEESANGLIYSQTKFLDAMSANWMGIVSEDYSVVCAVPCNKKFGIRYIYPPPYVQQSGLIGNGLSDAEISEAIRIMRSFSRYGEYYFNFSNKVKGEARQNFILPLQREYDTSMYPPDFRYDLKKAISSDLQYLISDDAKQGIDLYHYNLQQKKKTGTRFLKRLYNLINVYSKHNSVLTREVRSDSGELLSAVVCLRDKKRIYLLLSATTPEGRAKRANHFLMDKLLQEFMPSPLLLDFVGSDIKGIAHYYRNFTDISQPYHLVKWNHLPIPLRWLKK